MPGVFRTAQVIRHAGDEREIATKEVPMRIFASTTMALAMVLTAAAPARAQTYDPNYPVCMHRWVHRGDYYQCTFTSLAQCAATASGLAAQCIVNPYHARVYAKPGLSQRRSYMY